MTYNPNVPLGNQTIASTTSPIQTNFSQANTAFAVDHVAFATLVNQGMHNKVSLLTQTVDPVAVLTTPILYSKNITYPGAVVRTEEFIREASGDGGTVIALSSFFTAPVTGVNGSTFLPGIATANSGGLLLKWGTVQMLNGNNTVAVSFTGLGIGNFPNACFVALATPNSLSAGLIAANYPGTSGLATTGFNINRIGTAGNFFYQFVAIGN